MPGIIKDCSVIDDAAAETGLKLVHCVFDRFRFADPQCVSPQIQLIRRPVGNKVDSIVVMLKEEFTLFEEAGYEDMTLSEYADLVI